ncbi:RES family NAD+ phosphorylase, partial [Burkholderia cenocepacia]
MKQTHVRETAYRAHAPKWAFQPVSGAGAALNGGRLNRPGVDAFYVSLDLQTACDEYKGICPILPPATLVEYTLDLGPVVDFSGGYTAEWEPIWSELFCDWKALALNDIEPPSWVIGDIVRQQGFKGNTDQFGLAVIADEAKGVVERSSRNGPTTMQRQIGFAEAESAGKKRVTKRQRFLAEMEKVVPWSRLLSVIGPYYPKGERGRPPIGLERMLRIYLLQQWYGLSDEGLEDALYDSIAM